MNIAKLMNVKFLILAGFLGWSFHATSAEPINARPTGAEEISLDKAIALSQNRSMEMSLLQLTPVILSLNNPTTASNNHSGDIESTNNSIFYLPKVNVSPNTNLNLNITELERNKWAKTFPPINFQSIPTEKKIATFFIYEGSNSNTNLPMAIWLSLGGLMGALSLGKRKSTNNNISYELFKA